MKEKVEVSVSSEIAKRLNLADETADASKSTKVAISELLSRLNEHRATSEEPVITSFGQINLSFPAKEEKVESEAIIARRKYLLLQQEERAYNKMVYGVERNLQAEEVLSKGTSFSSFRHQASLGFNVLFSVVAAFGMIYYIAKQIGFDQAKSMIIGLVAGIAVLIVEMTLFILRAVRMESETEKTVSFRDANEAKFRSSGLVTNIPKTTVSKPQIEPAAKQ